MTRQPRTDDEFEADVTAMLARRASDADVLATTRLGDIRPQPRPVTSGRDRRSWIIGAVAACLLAIVGFAAFVTLSVDDPVTVASQSDTDRAPEPTTASVPANSGVQAESHCDSNEPNTAASAICRTTETTHIVVAGDFLSKIASTYGVTLDALLQANPDLDPALLTIGTELVIPPPTGVPTSDNPLCPAGYPIPRDTDGDGVVDTCYEEIGAPAATTGGSQATSTQDEPVPPAWEENVIGIDPPISLELWDLAIEASRYPALVNQAQNTFNAACMTNEGFPFPKIDLFAERTSGRASFDFELSPFSYDGGYALAANRASSGSSIGPTANALSAEQAAYVNALPAPDLARYEEAWAACLDQGGASIFNGSTSQEQFYELVNVGINLPFAAMNLVDTHPTTQANQGVWRQCMEDAGHQVESRSAAVQAAVEERLGQGSNPTIEPGETERAVSGSDRRCSATTGYSRQRGAALGAADRYLLTHDATVLNFVADWNLAISELRPKLIELVGVSLVEEVIPAPYVGRGVPLTEYLPTKAQFEQAFVEEVVFCTTEEGASEAEARALISSGETNWWLHGTIEVTRATIAQRGGGVLIEMLAEPRGSANTPMSLLDSCAQSASHLVSPKQRAETQPGFNGRFATEVERYGIKDQLATEWLLCMERAGYPDFENVGDIHQLNFDLAEQVRASTLTEDEALVIDKASFGAHFECMLTIDYGERWRLFSEQVSAELLAE